MLSKLGGTDDIVAAFRERGVIDVGLLRLQRDDVKTVHHAFVHESLDDFDYRPHDEQLADSKRRYRQFATRVLRHYRKWIGVGAIVTANIGYYAERELAAASTAIGLPFLALHKESIRTTTQRQIYEQVLRDHVGPFEGSSVAVYNDDERESQLRAGTVEPDRISVVGCARADVLHAMRKRPIARARPLIVYFAIDPEAGARQFNPHGDPQIAGADGEAVVPPRWEDVTAATEAALVAFARRRPDIDIVVKVKLGRWSITSARFHDVELPPNMWLVRGGLATSWLEQAIAVIGLNTTSIIEALVAGRHVIVPHFGEVAHADGFLFDLTSPVLMPTSPELLTEQLANLFAEGHQPHPAVVLSPSSRKMILKYLGDADGTAGDRTFAWVTAALAQPVPDQTVSR